MNLRKLFPAPARRLARRISDKVPLRVEWRRNRPTWYPDEDRWSYQSRYVEVAISPGDRVLDIGSGGYPFPYATYLADRYLEPTTHRNAPLRRSGKTLLAADIQHLPFRDKSFDYLYCSHVLEHVEDPLATCADIMRVSHRGFIETPTFGKDILFAWNNHTHRWHVVGIKNTLCFFEYLPRQTEGIRSSAWADLIFDKHYHPLQAAFYQNQDIFNVLFTWVEKFGVIVFRNDGTIECLNVELPINQQQQVS